jgi:hypothetical protein
VSSDNGAQQGLGNNDTITVDFNKNTNRPTVDRVHEVQKIVTAGTEKNSITEVQVVTCIATGGAFTVTFDGVTSGILFSGDALGTVESTLEGMSNINDVTVSFSNGAAACANTPGNNITISFESVVGAAGDLPEMTASNSLSGAGAAISVSTTVVGTAPVGGTFTLTMDYGGQAETTAAINSTSTASAVQAELEALANVGIVEVSRSLVFDEGGYIWLITFTGNSGNIPLLTGTSALTGSGTSLIITEVIAGTTIPEVQSVTSRSDELNLISSGQFKLSYLSQETDFLDYNAIDTMMKSKLEALSTIGRVEVVVRQLMLLVATLGM